MSNVYSVDLVVGIDFGMTCTGVAYSKPHPSRAIKHINNWPGKELESHNKVPSSVIYQTGGTAAKKLIGWGFKSQNVDGARDWFKLFLDPEHIRKATSGEHPLYSPAILNYDEIRRYYKDYMRCIYDHSSFKIQEKTGDWTSKRVAFVFSVPCTFRRPEIGNVLLQLIKEAGFGTESEYHTVDISMTEPEAAAAWTMKESPAEIKKHTTMLVCDAGGGTTDIAILRNVSEDEDNPRMEEVTIAEAIDVGSTNIDKAFENLAHTRLSEVVPALPGDTARSMMRSLEFTGWKHTFGGNEAKPYKSFPITVPTVKSDFNCHEAGIGNGKMHFSKLEFSNLFAPQVEKLIARIYEQIQRSRKDQSFYKLDYIILSGGLGSSPYVRSRLIDHFKSLELQVIVAEDPQLAVVKGLVIDRIQKSATGTAVLKSRKCPVSYGVGMSIKYDKNDPDHSEQPCYKGLDGQLYVKNQIFWLIRKGDPIDPEKPIVRPCNKDFRSSDTSRKVESTIYMSESNPKELPTNTSHADARYVCRLEADLTNLGLGELVSKKYPDKFFSSQRFHRADFETRMFVRPADLYFEIRFKGKLYGEKNISIKWT